MLAEIERTCDLLGEFLMIGVAVPGTWLRSHVTRCYYHRIIYRVTAERVEIRDVLHPSRNG
jgi:plasmid stabilization system protein ParE